MASRNESRIERNFGGVTTSAPYLISESMQSRLQGELSLMDEEATAARESFDLDTPSTHRSTSHNCPPGPLEKRRTCYEAPARRSYAFPTAYVRARERFIPLRCSDAELDPGRNHVEERMLSILDGECDHDGNPVEDCTAPVWLDGKTACGRNNQPQPAGPRTDDSPLWGMFDERTMELASYVDGQPQFRDRKSKKLIDPRNPRHWTNRRTKKNRQLSNRQPANRATLASVVSPQRVAQAVPLAPDHRPPSVPIAWDSVLMDVVPK